MATLKSRGGPLYRCSGNSWFITTNTAWFEDQLHTRHPQQQLLHVVLQPTLCNYYNTWTTDMCTQDGWVSCWPLLSVSTQPCLPHIVCTWVLPQDFLRYPQLSRSVFPEAVTECNVRQSSAVPPQFVSPGNRCRWWISTLDHAFYTSRTFMG